MNLDLELIRNKRKLKGITLLEMAKMLGYNNASSYVKYETGEYALTAEMLGKISVILNEDIKNFYKKTC